MGPITIPANFAKAMGEVYGEAGTEWIAGLPRLLAALADDWQLTLEPPFGLTYNYVAPAIRADGTAAVLKVGFPSRTFRNEMAALDVFAGDGAVRLLERDEARSAMLLERLMPGDPLETLDDDDEATRTGAHVMRHMWRPVPAEHDFPTVADWGKGFARLRKEFDGGAGPFSPSLVDEAEALFAGLTASMATPVVLHGDFHHGNILSAGHHDWRVIDAKGLVGEPAYEVGPFLYNPSRIYEQPDRELRTLLSRRLDILTGELGIDRQRLRGWAMAEAVLSAWWSYEDHGHGWERAIRAAEALRG